MNLLWTTERRFMSTITASAYAHDARDVYNFTLLGQPAFERETTVHDLAVRQRALYGFLRATSWKRASKCIASAAPGAWREGNQRFSGAGSGPVRGVNRSRTRNLAPSIRARANAGERLVAGSGAGRLERDDRAWRPCGLEFVHR